MITPTPATASLPPIPTQEELAGIISAHKGNEEHPYPTLVKASEALQWALPLLFKTLNQESGWLPLSDTEYEGLEAFKAAGWSSNGESAPDAGEVG